MRAALRGRSAAHRAAIAAVVLVMLAMTAAAHAALRLVPAARVDVQSTVEIALVVTSVGDETARNVTPQVTLDGNVRMGEPAVELGGGSARAWHVSFPRPARIGTTPAVVRVAYEDEAGAPRTAVAVLPVTSPGGPPGPVEASFPPHELYIEDYYLLHVTLRNVGDRPIVGRLSTFAASDLGAPPVVEAEVPAGGGVEVPLVFENLARRAGPVATIAVAFEYQLDGVADVAVAQAAMTLGGPAGAPPDRGPPALAAIALVALGVVAATRWWRGRPPFRRPRRRSAPG